jgi:hypothetical protein
MKYNQRIAFVMCFALVVSMVYTPVAEAACKFCSRELSGDNWECKSVTESQPYGWSKCRLISDWACQDRVILGSERCYHSCLTNTPPTCGPFTQFGLVSLEDLSLDDLDKVEEIKVSVQE